MKKFLLSLLPLIFLSFHGVSQTFQRAYGTTGSDGIGNVIEINGGFMLLGGTDSFGAGMGDQMLIKTNLVGDTLWCKAYGGNNNDGGEKIIKAINGGYISVGTTFSFGPGTPAKYNIYIVKTDSMGNLQWANAYGGTGWDAVSDIKRTADSAYIITGTTTSYGSGMIDVLLMKIDTMGNVLWVKTYGGVNDDWASSVEVLNDGGFILCGMTSTYSQWTGSCYLIRTNSMGDTVWTKTYGGPPSWVDAQDLQVLSNNDGFIFLGHTNNWGAGSTDLYLIKTDTAGNLLWSKTYGGIYDENAASIKERGDGHLLMTGYSPGFETNSTTWGNYRTFIVQVAPDGTFQLARIFGLGPTDYVCNILVLNDGYIFSGSTGTFGMGGADGYLVRTDLNGVSGCYETGSTIVVTNPPTQVSSGGGNISIPPIVAIPTATTQSSAPITPTIVCFLVGENEGEVNDFDINIYPSPSSGIFAVTSQEEIEAIEIYNILGEKVRSGSSSGSKKMEIDLSNEAKGIYFIKIQSGEKTRAQKIVIQ